MLRVGATPDVCTHATLLDGYFKYGLVEEAMLLFNELARKREYNDIVFYSVVINGLCKNSKLDEAHAIFEKLCSIGLLLDVRTYTVMINGFCLEGLFDEVKGILRKMEDNGCPPNNATYNVIVQGFLRLRQESHRTGKIIQVTDIANFMTEEPLASVNHWQKLAHSSLSQFTTPSVQRLIHLCITIGASEPIASVASTLLHRCSLISRVLLLLQVKTAAIGSVKTVFETLQLGVLEGKNGGRRGRYTIQDGDMWRMGDGEEWPWWMWAWNKGNHAQR
ncbi:hypothetical protein T459_16030 [Capsicum annuum]|uniref:Pentatricopeptide repeat-containing protein n=1 Tax=Capsicum annuum TaxID=4072 RepID=A0A2G2Z7J2_CAPAN|nr:hypothetical protein T459_16030 [Capsicum annuum]